jgi:hypothetical protein
MRNLPEVSQMENGTTQHEEDGAPAEGGGGLDLMIGHDPIRDFVVKEIGLPARTSAYHLKKRGWPIGNLPGSKPGSKGPLIASKQRLRRFAAKLAAS